MFGLQTTQTNEQFSDPRTAVNAVVFVCKIGAFPLEVFLRWGFGSRYIGMQAIAAFLLIPLWGGSWEGHDASALGWFFLGYCIMVIVARSDVIRRAMRGEITHSYYSGTPRLLAVVPAMSEVAIKRWLEPAVALMLAWYAGLFSPPLGSLLTFSTVCLFVLVNINEFWARTQVLNLNDRVVEQEILMGRFRASRGRGF
jgi:hypothetical protein